jgi:hypothetical protein
MHETRRTIRSVCKGWRNLTVHNKAFADNKKKRRGWARTFNVRFHRIFWFLDVFLWPFSVMQIDRKERQGLLQNKKSTTTKLNGRCNLFCCYMPVCINSVVVWLSNDWVRVNVPFKNSWTRWQVGQLLCTDMTSQLKPSACSRCHAW